MLRLEMSGPLPSTSCDIDRMRVVPFTLETEYLFRCKIRKAKDREGVCMRSASAQCCCVAVMSVGTGHVIRALI